MEMEHQNNIAPLPFISVVIPAYNEAALLPLCLYALKEQDYKGRIEVIVADNGSTDMTPRIAEFYGARTIFVSERGVARARNAGAREALGDIICFTDADTVAPPSWIRMLVTAFTKDQLLVAVGGRYDMIGITSPLKLVARLLIPLAFFIDRFNRGGTMCGVNMAIKKQALASVGWFDNDIMYGEDIDITARLRKIGKIKIVPAIRVKTSARRFNLGFMRSFRYAVTDYFASAWGGKKITHTFTAIRERPFDIYGNAIKRPMTLIFAPVFIILLIWASFSPRITIGGSTSHIKTNEKIIALTFDDGPNERDTSQVLRILNQKNIHATFFVVGQNVEREPDLAKDIVDSGNIIANHSFAHHMFAMAGEPDTTTEDTKQADQAIEKATGKSPRYYRPPYGFRTIWGTRALKKQGYEIITWNDMTIDYWNISPTRIANHIISHAKPGGIIVLHDGGENKENVNRDHTVIALPKIIDELQKKGYRFVTIDELVGQGAYF